MILQIAEEIKTLEQQKEDTEFLLEQYRDGKMTAVVGMRFLNHVTYTFKPLAESRRVGMMERTVRMTVTDQLEKNLKYIRRKLDAIHDNYCASGQSDRV